MPYIKPEAREYYRNHGALDELSQALNKINLEEAKGDLNYIIFYLVRKYIQERGLGYFKISTMIGALEDCADELRRRVLHPYEDSCIKKNGDI